MFGERDILYFEPFFFKNGNQAKNKYFVVLKHTGIETLLATLPSSRDFVPKNAENLEGCIDLFDSSFNCYVISNTTQVTECGKSFPLKTFIYGHQIEEYLVKDLEVQYPKEGVNYSRWGKMDATVFSNLISCLSTSRVVKNKFKRKLLVK